MFPIIHELKMHDRNDKLSTHEKNLEKNYMNSHDNDKTFYRQHIGCHINHGYLTISVKYASYHGVTRRLPSWNN